MKIFSSSFPPVVTIVVCVHGDEPFGLKLIDQFQNNLDHHPGLQLVIANEKALEQNRRCMETDLNRSFCVKVPRSYEECLAARLRSVLCESIFVLDIHETTSDIRMTPVVTALNEKTKRIINLCQSQEVAFIQKPLAKKSLIGQCEGGVSLEFGRAYTKTKEALDEAIQIVLDLLSEKKREPMIRDIFCIDGSLSKEIELPDDIQNFKYIHSLGVYPFLYGERAYPDLHALSATKKYHEVI